MQYIAQTKTLTGVIFHYSEDHLVESLFYSNDELKMMADNGISPEL